MNESLTNTGAERTNLFAFGAETGFGDRGNPNPTVVWRGLVDEMRAGQFTLNFDSLNPDHVTSVNSARGVLIEIINGAQTWGHNPSRVGDVRGLEIKTLIEGRNARFHSLKGIEIDVPRRASNPHELELDKITGLAHGIHLIRTHNVNNEADPDPLGESYVGFRNDASTELAEKLVLIPNSTVINEFGDPDFMLPTNRPFIKLYTVGNVTYSNPLPSGIDGQVITIVGVDSDSSGSVLQNGGNLKLGAPTRSVSNMSSITLMYVFEDVVNYMGYWVEIASSSK